MPITGGFGFTIDFKGVEFDWFKKQTIRHWVIGRDGVKRWVDTGLPVVDAIQEPVLPIKDSNDL